jgi:hypothetical protein
MSRGGFVFALFLTPAPAACAEAASRKLGEVGARHAARVAPPGEGRSRFATGGGAPPNFRNSSIFGIYLASFGKFRDVASLFLHPDSLARLRD